MKQQGFTLMEMIGVMAVIAILAAVASPKIFEAIEDAKVSAYIQEANSLKVAAAQHYKDTGRWPRHIPSHANSRYHDLLVNDSDGNGTAQKGWNGPYLEKEMTHQLVDGEYQDLQYTNDSNWNCDIDGDGNRDGSFLVYRTDQVSDELAKKISDIIDGDGDVTSGDGSWEKAGRVKRYGTNSDHAHILLYCIAQG
jgi:prepilin-type N-terminal cleavage/methylation domain-containing protein